MNNVESSLTKEDYLYRVHWRNLLYYACLLIRRYIYIQIYLSSKAAASMHLIEFYMKQKFVGFEQSSKSPVEFSIQVSLLFDLDRVSSIEFRALC